MEISGKTVINLIEKSVILINFSVSLSRLF